MDKNNYILLFRKDDLIDLYKFGKLNAYCASVSFNGDIDTLNKDKKKAKDLFKQANPFDYSLEYYILHVATDKKLTAAKREISVYDVVGVYAIDQNAYGFGLQLSPEVTLNPPIPALEKEYYEFQIGIALKDAEIGIENVGQVFRRDMKAIGSQKGFITKGIKEEVIRDAFDGAPVRGKHSIWYYLLRYERHQNYPKDIRGYYLDTLHVYKNFQEGKYFDAPTTKSKLGAKIMTDFGENAKLVDLDNFIDFQHPFVDSLDKEFNGFHSIAPLYLLLKDTFKEGLMDGPEYYGKYISEFVESLGDSMKYNQRNLNFALYLLGFSLGRELTYKFSYLFNQLPILVTK